MGTRSWLPLGTLVAHVIEELPRFPQWATRHFGTTSTQFYVLSHVLLLALVCYITYRASRPGARLLWLWLVLAVQCALATNGIFHLGATLVFGEYSPGLLTGVAFYLPVTAYLLPLAGRPLGTTATAAAGLTGACVSALVTASLWLDITIV